jgi:hypothetical protein
MALLTSRPCQLRHGAFGGSRQPVLAASHRANDALQRVNASVQTFAGGSSSPARHAQLPAGYTGSVRHSSSGRFAQRRRQRGDACVTCSLQETAVGLGLFFTPSILATIYAGVIGKGNVKDGFSKLLTQVSNACDVVLARCELCLPSPSNTHRGIKCGVVCPNMCVACQQVSQGYFQPNVGGENIPSATGELSDLAGDEPLFKSLFKWSVCVISYKTACTFGLRSIGQLHAPLHWATAQQLPAAYGTLHMHGRAAGSSSMAPCSSWPLVLRPSSLYRTRWLSGTC